MNTRKVQSVCRAGSSMVEIVMATMLSGIVIVGALNVMGGAIKTRVANVAHVDGPMLANELIAEIMAQPFEDPEAPGTGEILGLGREPGETTRETFDDVDDYHAYSESPPVDRAGVEMTEYTDWTRSVGAWHATPEDGSIDSGTTSTGVKVIQVQVTAPDGTVIQRGGYRAEDGALEQSAPVNSEITTWVGAELQIGALGVARAGTNIVNAATD